MDKVLQYIEEHLEEPLNIKQLADMSGYSEFHFIRKFKAYTNWFSAITSSNNESRN